MFKFKDYDFKQYKVSILVIIMMLGTVGAYLLQKLQDDGERQFEKQLIGLAVGVIVAIAVSLVDYHCIGRLYIVLYGLNLILLLMVRYSPWGYKHYTAQRWLKFTLGSRSAEIQPSELTKIILIVFFAKFLDMFRRQINNVWTLLAFLGLMAIPIFFILKQPDLSTSIVMAATLLVMLFVAGLSYKIIGAVIAIGIPLAVAGFWYIQQPYQILLNEYQQGRVLAMLNPDQHNDEVYQQLNAKTAIIAGGMSGKLANGSATLKSHKVPVITSDFIFTAIAEAFGFIGSVIVILLFMLFIYKCIQIAKRAKDFMGMLVATGIGSLLMFQIFVNIGVVTSLLPNTGIPLPFVSSGLSSLLTNMLMIGILLNVSLQGKKKEREVL